MKKTINATCTLCFNYDSNRRKCSLLNETVENDLDHNLAMECVTTGKFMRDLNVIPEMHHWFNDPNMVPYGWEKDYSRLPKDDEGLPIFVLTKKGTERAIPVDPSMKIKGDLHVGIEKALTYQGQRELIYDLGVELAQKEAVRVGVPLQVLPGEEGYEGQPYEIQKYMEYKQNIVNPQNEWFLNPNEEW